MPKQVYIAGKLVPEDEAKVSVFDHGLLYGDGVFEGIRVYSGRVFLLAEHVTGSTYAAGVACLLYAANPQYTLWNSYFAYGNSNAFPSSSAGGTNYWVDVLYVPAGGGVKQMNQAAN